MSNRTLIKISLALSIISILLCGTSPAAKRRFRHWLAGSVMWQWKRGSLASAKAYSWLWQGGNGE